MIPVVLSGGSGSRLWPISRSSYPKQFCDIFDEPLLIKTLKRLSGWDNPYVVTVKALDVLTEKSFKILGLSESRIIYEPAAKNTAAAVALLCYRLKIEGFGDQVAGVFPADHMIANEEEFKKVVDFAVSCAEKGKIATVGIKPAYPATGFGYIECQESVYDAKNLKAFKVSRFREKPDLKTAKEFVAKNNYFWNAGMFIFKVSVMIDAFKKHMPELWHEIEKIKPDFSNLAEIYESLKPVSVDTGIMEKYEQQVCVPCDIGWSDLGSWDDFAKMLGDETGSSLAETLTVGSENNFVFALKHKTIGLVGVEGLIVVDTPDALLISKKGHSQEIKTLVENLNKTKNSKAKDHTFDVRPWGQYEVISDTSDYKIKIILVDPGQQISYQSHDHRAEHWVVIAGEGDVIIEDQTIPVKPGSAVIIPQNSKHRIKNTGARPLRFVEVQTGDYFGEDDIVRYSDDYKRV